MPRKKKLATAPERRGRKAAPTKRKAGVAAAIGKLIKSGRSGLKPRIAPRTRSKSIPSGSNAAAVKDDLKVKQESQYLGNDWWRWSVWIEGSSAALAEVDYVEYQLHPTFPDPLQRRSDPKNNFRLDTAGWGEFMIHVTIARKSGSSLKRQHWLSLQYPPVSSSSTSSAGRQPRKREDRPTIYLSSGITDWGLGKAVGKALEEKGFDVLSKDEAPLGVPWDRAFSKLVDRADLFIPLISGEISSWTIREIEAARQRKLPIIPVLCGAEARLPDSLKEFQTISVESGASLDQVAPGIAEQIAGAVDLPSRK